MDPFALKMLEKAKLRSKNLGINTDFSALEEIQNKAEKAFKDQFDLKSNVKDFDKNDVNTLSETKDKSTITATKKTFNVDKENIGIEINVTSDHQIEKVEIEVQEENGTTKEIYCANEDKATRIRDCSRNQLKRLGALYSNTNEISSPIHRTENKFFEASFAEKNDSKPHQNLRAIRKPTKLTELANEMKNWDDEIKTPRNKFDDHVTETTKERQIQSENEVTKKLKWDSHVMQSLEAQGFQRVEASSNKIQYNYSSPVKNNYKSNNEFTEKKTSPKFKVKHIDTPKTVVSTEKKVLTRNNVNESTTSSQKSNLPTNFSKSNYKDPIDLPLKERMKLFEQNKGKAPIPRVPFAMNVPAKKVCEQAVKEHLMYQKASHNKNEQTQNKQTNFKVRCANFENKFEGFQQQHIDLIKSKTETATKSNNYINKQQTESGLSNIVSQFENKKENHQENNENNKISPKRLYPSLNDLKAGMDVNSDDNEYSTEVIGDDGPIRKVSRTSSTNESSYSLNISCESINFEQNHVRFDTDENKAYSNETHNYSSDSSINSKITGNSGDVSDYLNDALDDDDDDNESVTTNTDSIIRTQGSQGTSQASKNVNQVKSELSVEESKENMVTLVHTISFYRKQQNNSSNPNTPIRKIQREQEIRRAIVEETEESSDFDDCFDNIDQQEIEERIVRDKLAKLKDEVCKQQQIISQTSQALNLCAATIEFSGSTEAVEGERHLLVATHRRQAALDEIQRLRVEGTLRPSGAPKEKGRLTVKEMSVPLRQDYVRKLSNDAISGHHLLCLLKYNDIVLATQTVPTLPGLLSVRFPDVLHLNEVYADFRVTLEIYGMTAQREILPHEIKYHINTNKNKSSRTPKKKGGTESRLIMPIVQSPAGPNAVRTPALVQYGFAIFSLREVQRNTWTLTKVSGVSPLEGNVNMKIKCELSVSIGYKGFLTMFEDISGFGAWHRRWCYLNGHILNYWKYPDDEKKSPPIGSIDLNAAITQKVTTAPRDICARLNTIMLECKVYSKPDDSLLNKSSLTMITKDEMLVMRYLLSADTKEERDEWCAHLNKALMLLRAWSSTDKNEKDDF